MHIWSMKWSVPDPKVDQRGLGEGHTKKVCQAHKLNIEDAMDHSKWKKLIKDS